MRRLAYKVMALICLVTTANADIYDDCAAAISANNIDEVKKLSAAIQELSRIPVTKLIAARLCVSAAMGEPMVYIKKDKSFIPRAEFAASNAEKAADRIALQKLESDLISTIAEVEKRAACVNAKSFRINDELKAIDERFEQRNEQLIFDDTHHACSELYSSNKSSAMLNQTCVAAFQRVGHPNLVFLEAGQRTTLTTELSKLVELRNSLTSELLDTKVQLIAVEGGKADETLKKERAQKLADHLEAKSCAEFGYENVYLD